MPGHYSPLGLLAALALLASSVAGLAQDKVNLVTNAEIAAGEIDVLQYLAQAPGHSIGVLDAKRVARTIEVVAGAFELKSAVKPEDVYAPGMVV